MGAPIPEMEPVENPSAEALLSSLKTIDPGERRKHASVFNYWLSIRGNRQFPPIRDLDPLEISDAGPWSLLLEMIGGGEDAVVRHFGQAIKGDLQVEKVGDAPNPSLLSCIHAKLPLIAACREAFAFEETFDADGGPARCWVTLLPFSATGAWIDFVYGYVSIDPVPGEEPAAAVEAEPVNMAEDEPDDVLDVPEPEPEVAQEPETEAEEETAEPFKVPLGRLDGEEDEPSEQNQPEAELHEPDVAAEIDPEPEPAPEPEPEAELEAAPEPEPEPEPEEVLAEVPDYEPEPEDESVPSSRPSFSAKLLESLANVGGFYGKVTQSGPELPQGAEFVEAEDAEQWPDVTDHAEPEEAVDETAEAQVYVEAEERSEPAYAVEGDLNSKLNEVRALAEEAREAQIRSNLALYEGLAAAYDFALDAEDQPEEYLRLVEAQGLKIQLRSPMKPVVKLAFDGMCDEPTIKQLEAVLAWALKQDLPRGTLADRIQEEGGIGAILNGQAKAA